MFDWNLPTDLSFVTKTLHTCERQIQTPTLQVAEERIKYIQLDSSLILDIPMAHTSTEESNQMLYSQANKGKQRIKKPNEEGSVHSIPKDV